MKCSIWKESLVAIWMTKMLFDCYFSQSCFMKIGHSNQQYLGLLTSGILYRVFVSKEPEIKSQNSYRLRVLVFVWFAPQLCMLTFFIFLVFVIYLFILKKLIRVGKIIFKKNIENECVFTFL